MSSNHHMGATTPNGEIEHMNFLSEHIGALYLNDAYSDIVLKVDDTRFHAHKVILAARSEYFRALLYGGMKESHQAEIELKDTSIEAFKALLKYIYTGHLSLTSVKDIVLDMLGLAHQFGFVELEAAISDYLRQTLSIQDVCAVFDAARLYHLHYLTKVCTTFMDSHATHIIAHPTFNQLTASGLKELVDRDSFFAPEVDIFRAVVEWIRANNVAAGAQRDSILECVRLPLISIVDLLTVVRPQQLVKSDTILDAIQTTVSRGVVRRRGCLLPEENMAHPKFGTQVLSGEMRSALLNGDSVNYDMERGYTRHTIVDPGQGQAESGILVKLGKQAIVNHVRMLLWDRDLRSYSYYIETSMDQKEWTRVVDHSLYYCRSWQLLYFEPVVVRYVRLVGTNNTVNKVFHVVSFEIMWTAAQFQIDKGLIVPRQNVATYPFSATVVEGVSRSRNALLDGNTSNYDWDSGYTCHQLGSGSILVQLGQPYMIDSIRLLLWDCDDRSYNYYVETSVNMADWELVCDKTNDNCKSWQTIRFDRRPVVFIRVIGTHNTANEVFHCVHLECPAQVPTPEDGTSPRTQGQTQGQFPSSQGQGQQSRDNCKPVGKVERQQRGGHFVWHSAAPGDAEAAGGGGEQEWVTAPQTIEDAAPSDDENTNETT
ncbi:BTB/POZ domain-containing protein 9 [Nilaparvata lugens]|uniref:BTB/POZ domain-containing protein 9 n=1 Tax=Nilaparvata lugens TaxID=108931 RepID=UPI00193E4750|nr:BTB/POZ domain-containing protein 9 [Nilaparvata lugens]